MPTIINTVDFFTNTKYFIKNKYFEGMCKKTDKFNLNPNFITQLYSKIFPEADLKKWRCRTDKDGKTLPIDITYLSYYFIHEKDEPLMDKIFEHFTFPYSNCDKFYYMSPLNCEINYLISFLECIMFPKICEKRALINKCVINPTRTYCPILDGEKKFIEFDNSIAVSKNIPVKQYDITWTFDKKRFSHMNKSKFNRVINTLFNKFSDGKQRYFADYCNDDMYYSNIRQEVIYGVVENWLLDKFQGLFDNYNYDYCQNPLIIKYVHLWSEEEIYSDHKTEKRDDQFKIKISLTVSRIKNDCTHNYYIEYLC